MSRLLALLLLAIPLPPTWAQYVIPSNATITYSSAPPSSAPAAAAAVGYNTQTFSSTALGTTIGTWQYYNYSGNTGCNSGVSQSGANIVISGASPCNAYNAQVATAVLNAAKPFGWQGIAFGGGAYFECAFSMTGTPSGSVATPSFWANDIELQSGGYASTVHWQGQATNYNHWGELDIIEANVASLTAYGGVFHDDYGILPSASQVNPPTGSPFTGLSGSLNNNNTFAALWVPATGSTSGYVKYYYNGTQVGTFSWSSQYNAATAPPPVSGTTAGSIMDVRHWFLILGNSQSATPMTITGCDVWQASGANNWQY